MSVNLAEAAATHRFPPLFFRFPRLLGLVHLLMRLTTLRVWYVRRAFRRVLGAQAGPFTLLDAGCGHGDYVFACAPRFRGGRFLGVDKIRDNIDVCRAYAAARGLDNVAFVEGHIETYAPAAPVDVLACIGVMQLVDDDRGLLDRFHRNLKPGGRLVLYESVHGRRLLPFFERVLSRYFVPYHEVQGRQHVYTPDEIRGKLDAAGFVVEETTSTFGWAGKLYYELYTLLMQTILGAHWIFYPILVPLFVAFLPLFWLLMAVDMLGRRTDGNGLVVVARKR